MRRWLPTTALLVGGCLSAEAPSLPIPEDLDWITTVTVFEDGLAAGSSFEPRPIGSLAVSHRAGHTTYVLGFRNSDLEPIFALDPGLRTRLGEKVTRPAVACEAGLPAPSWAVAIDPAGQLQTEPSITSIPSLSFDGLESLCPPLIPEDIDPLVVAPYSIERAVPCSVCEVGSFTPTPSACELAFDLGRCGYDRGGRAIAHLGWDGSLCFDAGPCTSEGIDEEGHALFRCQAATPSVCDKEPNRLLRGHVDARDSFFERSEVRLFPDRSDERFLLPDFHEPEQFESYLSSMIELDDRIMLTTHPGSAAGYVCRWRDGEEIADPGPTELIFVDPETLAIVDTATAPACLTRTMPDPLGEGFLGVWVAGPSDLRLGRFDRGGRMIQQIALELPEVEHCDKWVAGLQQIEPGGPIIVVIGGHETMSDFQILAEYNHVLFVDPSLTVSPVEIPLDTLMPDESRGVRLEQSISVDFGSPRGPGLALLDGQTDTVHGVEREGGVVFSARSAIPTISGSYRLLAMLSARPNQLGVSTGGSTREVFELVVQDGSARVGGRAIPFERDAEVTQLIPWTETQALVIAKIVPNPSTRSYVTRLDLDSWRFVPGARWLAGSADEDPGIVHAHLVDRKGRVWLGFGYTGWLYRLSSRRPGR